MMKKYSLLTLTLMVLMHFTYAQKVISQKIIVGAERLSIYLPSLKNKNVAVFANQTSMVGKTHLVDTLISSGIKIVKIFGPEHGFRGKADAGEHVSDAKDKKTGISVISLYGSHKAPTEADLKGVDIVVFDIQDVGVRFYTYISSLEYLIEACAQFNKLLIVLDRPNPNGFYIDGPVLDKKFKSFIGMQEIPIVYGMTIGEYANMLVYENLLDKTDLHQITTQINNETPQQLAIDYVMKNKDEVGNIDLKIITCLNYDHKSKYILPVNPSPNLREMQSIYWYPSTCFFEGTVLSEGRGTDKPFQIFGHPTLPKKLYKFTPKPNEGAKSSKCFNQVCYGWNLNGTTNDIIKKVDNKIQLKYFIDAYKLFGGKDSFFLKNNFIHKLAGTDEFANQIKAGKTEAEIKKTWQHGIAKFKTIRKKYLLYKDFE